MSSLSGAGRFGPTWFSQHGGAWMAATPYIGILPTQRHLRLCERQIGLHHYRFTGCVVWYGISTGQ